MRPPLAVALIALAVAPFASAQTRPEPKPGPWFGLTLPGGTGRAPAVLVGARPARPVALAPGESPAAEFTAATLKADVQTIVEFAVSGPSRARGIRPRSVR